MKISCHKKGTISILEIKGKMHDEAEVQQLIVNFNRLLDEGERKFVIDLTGVTMTLTCGVNTVVSCRNKAVRRDGVVKLAVTGKVKEVYLVMFLDNLFEMHDDVQEALASFAA